MQKHQIISQGLARACFAFAVAAALVFAFVAAMPAQAHAESLTGSSNWTVTFTSGAKMVDNYSASQWADDVRQLQPGDDITFTVTQKHEYATSADWYMSNEVLKTLEYLGQGEQGSNYQYLLTYEGPAGSQNSRVLYDSTDVGGDNSNGLLDATSALDEFFYMDTLSQGQTAKVTLKVTLDGETEGNAYFDTIGQLKMRFAVELSSDTPNNDRSRNVTNNRNVVQTGDDTNLFPYYVAMVISGALLLLFVVDSVRRRKRDDSASKRGGHVR